MWASRYLRPAPFLFFGEDFDDIIQEGRAVHLPRALMEFDMGELRDPVDRQEHVEFSDGEPQLADIDVDVPVVSFDAWSSARTRGVVRALP